MIGAIGRNSQAGFTKEGVVIIPDRAVKSSHGISGSRLPGGTFAEGEPWSHYVQSPLHISPSNRSCGSLTSAIAQTSVNQVARSSAWF